MIIEYDKDDLKQTFRVDERKLSHVRIVAPTENDCHVIIWYTPNCHEGIIVFDGDTETGQSIYQRLSEKLKTY